MNVHRALQKRVRLVRQHHRAENLDQLAPLRGQNGCAQNAVVRSVNDNFHEPGGFSALDGARNVRHRTSSNLELVALRASFFLRHAHTAELWIGEHAIRHKSVFRREVFPFHEVAVHDLKIVVRDVCEGGTTFAITQRPDSGNARFQAGVDLDRTVFVRGNASLLETQIICIWNATGGDKEMRTGNFRSALREFARESDVTIFPAHCFGARLQKELQAFRLQRLLQFRGCFRVLAGHNLRSLMNNGSATAVAAKHLSKLQAEVPTAENEQVLGNLGELHDRFVVEEGHFPQARNRWNTRAPARVNENLLTLDDLVANLKLIRCRKSRPASIKAKILALVHPPLLAATKAQHNFVFLSNDFCEIHADGSDIDAPA